MSIFFSTAYLITHRCVCRRWWHGSAASVWSLTASQSACPILYHFLLPLNPRSWQISLQVAELYPMCVCGQVCVCVCVAYPEKKIPVYQSYNNWEISEHSCRNLEKTSLARLQVATCYQVCVCVCVCGCVSVIKKNRLFLRSSIVYPLSQSRWRGHGEWRWKQRRFNTTGSIMPLVKQAFIKSEMATNVRLCLAIKHGVLIWKWTD